MTDKLLDPRLCNSVHQRWGQCELAPHKDMPHRARSEPFITQKEYQGRIYNMSARINHTWSDHDPEAMRVTHDQPNG